VLMNQAILVAILQMLLNFLQALAYALLVFGAFRIFRSFPLERYFQRVRFYHRLIPALALAGLAFTPIKYLLGLLFSFPLDFSKAWVPPLLKFFEGLGFLAMLVYLYLCSRREEGRQKIGGSRRIWVWVGAAAVVLATVGGVYYYLSSRGYIVRFSIFRPEYLEYRSESPRFSFSYPSKFVLDKDEENRFGKDYLIGIKLPSDARVGCDVRAVRGKLDLSGSLEDITKKIAAEISQGAEGFQVLDSSFTEIGGEKAVKLEITFKGPLGETMRTDQVFTSHGGNVYTLVCGTTKDTFDFFAEDFSYFLKHFAWE